MTFKNDYIQPMSYDQRLHAAIQEVGRMIQNAPKGATFTVVKEQEGSTLTSCRAILTVTMETKLR